MKKHTLTAITAITAAALLTGCGAVRETENITFVSVNGIRNYAADYRSDPDSALKQVIAEKTESDKTVALQDGQFTITEHLNASDTVLWSGIYSADSAAVRFTYTDAAVSGNAPKEKYTGRLSELNKTGAFPSAVIPRVYLADAAKFFSGLPIALMEEDDSLCFTEMHDDFFCVPFYGLAVEGKYQPGSDFSLSYVPADTLRNDRYSKAYMQNDAQSFALLPDEEKLSAELQITAAHYGLSDPGVMQFRVAFSGGKWEMTAADGTAVGKGGYSESKEHPGFLTVYDEPEDPQAKDTMDNLYPLFLYIDSTNQIFYPGFVRKE